MHFVTFPLRPRDQGAEVANLQAALALLFGRQALVDELGLREDLLGGLEREAREQIYAGATEKAVAIFQERRGLEVTGAVDEPTAAALNAALREQGALAGDPADWRLLLKPLDTQVETLRQIGTQLGGLADAETLRGVKQGTDHLARIDDGIARLADGGAPLPFGARGVAVRDLQTLLKTAGFALPQNETEENILGAGTRSALITLQEQHQLARTGVFDDATRNALKLAADAAAHPQRVEGRIFLDNGLPAANMTLRIVSAGFAGRVGFTHEVQTDERGFYALPYDPGSAPANLEVYALDQQRQPVRLSLPKVNAARHELLNLVAPAALQQQASEYQLLAADLAPHIGGDLGNLRQAVESDERQDVSLLHQATGWDARLIALATSAGKLSEATSLKQDVLYSALRAGLPVDKDALALVSPDAFKAALDRAQAAGIVSLTDEEHNNALTQFNKLALSVRSSTVAPGAVSSIGALIGTSELNSEAQTEFGKLLLMEELDGTELWKAAATHGIQEQQIAGLQLQGKLAYLTLNNVPLTERLLGLLGDKADLAGLVKEDLYKKAAWITLLNKLATDPETQEVSNEKLAQLVPPASSEVELHERLDDYAEDMARKVRESFPTLVVARMLDTDALVLGTEHAALKAPTHTLLTRASAQGFQLGQRPLSQLIEQHRDALLGDMPEGERAKAIKGAQILQRAYQMSPTDEAMAALLKLGFTSAGQVTAIPRDLFIERYGDRFDSRAAAELVYTKSEQITTVTHNIYTIAKRTESNPPIPALFGSPERRADEQQRLNEALKPYPTMTSLFGSLDFCECEHCRSVLSPAAYLVDLLLFTDPRDHVWQRFLEDWQARHHGQPYPHPKPYDELSERRPDLSLIELTCENTNTALPYIDLVNEILELYIASTNNPDLEPVRSTGAATTDELLAEPQHLIADAYDTLAQARYPLALPFNLWLEQLRRFCAQLETPLWQALEAFLPADPALPHDRTKILAEYLGITPDEYALYTAKSLAGWPALYGLDPANEAQALSTLKSAKTLARRLEVSYKELVALLQTGFVNPQLRNLEMLHRLGLNTVDVLSYKGVDGYPKLSDGEREAFKQHLAQRGAAIGPNFDASGWLDTTWSAGAFNSILVLRDEDPGCNFEQTTVQHADRTPVQPLDLVRLNLLVRLWRRLGWPLDDLDRALQIFAPAEPPVTDTTLGLAMQTALVSLAHLQALDSQLGLGKGSRQQLLSLWAAMIARGPASLYAQLFLTRAILRDDPAFDDPHGNYLAAPHQRISAPNAKDHLPALQSALRLSAEEIGLILATVGSTPGTAELSLATVSLLYRHGLLARALKLSVAELIALKEISGCDPFMPLAPRSPNAPGDDLPLRQTLEFVRLAQVVRASGLGITDLDYLFRHRSDPLGPHREQPGARLALFQALAAELRGIAADHALPSDPAQITDDLLREKLAKLFAPDLIETFLDFWKGSRTFTAAQPMVPPAIQLHPERYQTGGLRLAYDPDEQRQQASYSGVLTDDIKAGMLAAVPVPAADAPQEERDAYQLFETLLDRLAGSSLQQAMAFFSAAFDGLLVFEEVFSAAPQAARRERLLRKILPLLERKLVRQAIVQRVAAQTESDPALVEALLTDPALLALPDQPSRPLLEHLAALATRGLRVEHYSSNDLSGTPAATAVQAAAEVAAGGGVNSARWGGAIEVPETGVYRFYVEFGTLDQLAILRFEQLAEPDSTIAAALNAESTSTQIELRAGTLYPVTIEAGKLQNGRFALLVKGETARKSDLSRLGLLPADILATAERAWTLLHKALLLARGLALSPRELRHIRANNAFDGLDWGRLPTAPANDPAAANLLSARLFAAHTRVLGYLALRGTLAGDDGRLIAIFEAAHKATPESVARLCQRLAELTRRDPAAVQATAQQLGMRQPEHFADAQRLQRLCEALRIVERFGVPPSTLAGWLTVRPTAAIAGAVRNALKARYDSDTWQRIARRIFDPLRQRQRDALVAYIMHTKDFASIEQLFEYFLIDPGMEPVVQTSRIRLAISSVQTFIQRCFLNLEKHVHPQALNAQHWDWMKRYRVWEANRKIFLFPENWLEPEWRDDKTHLFQAWESSLLQSDLTNELAEQAFFGYLNGLDQIARLEIVTMYAEERPTDTPILHVIGRTYTTPHTYFYRRYSHQMWTPWEPVSAQVEGDHVVAAVWRGRLHLFWLTFIEKVEASEPTSNTRSSDTTSLRASRSVPSSLLRLDGKPASDTESAQVQLPPPPPPPPPQPRAETLQTMNVETLQSRTRQMAQTSTRRTLDIQLSWSEYFQGEWSERASTGFDYHAGLREPFDPHKVIVQVSKETDIETGDDGTLQLSLGGSLKNAFRITSKQSRPAFRSFPRVVEERVRPLYSTSNTRSNRHTGTGPLTVTFTDTITTTDGDKTVKEQDTQTVLRQGGAFTLLPTSNRMFPLHEVIAQLINPEQEIIRLISPVFYQDDRHTFYVEPSLTETTIDHWEGYGVMRPSAKPVWEGYINVPPPVRVTIPPQYTHVRPGLAAGKPPLPDPIDRLALHAINEAADWLTHSTLDVKLGTALIGPTGGRGFEQKFGGNR